MLEDYRKLLEQNYLNISKLEKKIENININILKEEDLIKLYQTIIERQEENKKNKKILNKSIICGPMIAMFFGTILLVVDKFFLLHNLELIPGIIGMLFPSVFFSFALYNMSCYDKYKKILNNLIENGLVTQEEVKELLKKNKFYFDFKEYKIEKEIAIKQEQISSFEREKICLLEENSRIRKALELKEQVLNDRLIEKELLTEFENFLEEKYNVEDIHLYNYDEPIKLTFTNK